MVQFFIRFKLGLCSWNNLDQSSTIRGRTNIAHFEDIFINFFVCKFSFLLLIHALKPPRFLVCDDLRKIFCKINPIKAKKEIGTMYYVPDGTKKCGYYECKKCGNRFLSLQTMEKIPCPDCEAEIDYEIGPDESMEDILDTAQLLQKIEGEEEVEKMDALLSLAITGGDCNWI